MTEDKYRRFLLDNQDLIRQLAYTYAEKMRDVAQEARAAFDAGQADPLVKEAQDNSMMTNNGYLQSSLLFTQSAEDAQRLTYELVRLCDEALDEDAD